MEKLKAPDTLPLQLTTIFPVPRIGPRHGFMLKRHYRLNILRDK